jgi:hypothetical protein
MRCAAEKLYAEWIAKMPFGVWAEDPDSEFLFNEEIVFDLAEEYADDVTLTEYASAPPDAQPAVQRVVPDAVPAAGK